MLHSRASGPDGSSRVTCTPRRAARYPSAPSSVDLPPPGSATKTASPERSRTSIGKCRSRKTGRRQVPERAEQRGLAAAGLGNEDREPGALPHLHREVQVEEDRPAAGTRGEPNE